MSAGLDFWGESIRPFHLVTDKMKVRGDPSGEKKVLVTVTSEAFGLMLYANGRDKWLADWEYKKGNKNKRVPMYKKDDPATHKFANKWSTSRTGQIKGGGWDAGALEYLKKVLKILKDKRKYEEENGYPTFKYGQILIKKARQIDLNETQQPPQKRAKKAQSTAEAAILSVDFEFEDE